MKQHSVTLKVKCSTSITTKEQIKQHLAEVFELQSVKFPLKSGTGPAKGGNFERELGAKFSLWWTNGEDKFVFSRRAGSGGAKRDKTGKSDSSGDLTADKPIGAALMNRYSVEAKFYGDLTGQLWNLIAKKPAKQLEDFWKQATDSAKPYNRFSLLILRCNSREPLVITDDPYFESFSFSIKIMVGNSKTYLFTLSDFFSTDPQVFKEEMAPPKKEKIQFIRKGTSRNNQNMNT